MIIMAIDGACRRNGKPNCLSVGSVFTKTSNGEFRLAIVHEKVSTNQRGELKALTAALGLGATLTINTQDIYLITDSEYVFNTVSKDWIGNWRRKNWIAGSGEPVKNRDIWETAGVLLDSYKSNDVSLIPYHIKGHMLSFGKVAAANLIKADNSGKLLYDAVKLKLATNGLKQEDYDHAWQLFERNHGHTPPVDVFLEMIACNTVADLAAGYHADIIDAEWLKM
jgi:ribonuclease HI